MRTNRKYVCLASPLPHTNSIMSMFDQVWSVYSVSICVVAKKWKIHCLDYTRILSYLKTYVRRLEEKCAERGGETKEEYGW